MRTDAGSRESRQEAPIKAGDRRERRDWVQTVALAFPVIVLVAIAWNRRWIADDAMVNLRVIDQLEAGRGLVFNGGERVEATTSAAWLLLVALVHQLTGRSIELSWIAVVLGIAFAALAVSLSIRASSRLQRGAGLVGRAWPAGALVVVALPPVWDFSSSGLEVSLVFVWMAATFLALTNRWCAQDSSRTEPISAASPRSMRDEHAVISPWPSPFRPWWLPVFIGTGVLIRPDLGIFVVAFAVVLWAFSAPGWRGRILSAVLVGSVPATFEVFRMGYFGSLVPNTALAKDFVGADWSRGLNYLRDFLGTYALLIPAALLVVLIKVVPQQARSGEPGRRVVLLWVAPMAAALVSVLYVVRLGGDFMHARFLLPATFAALMPMAVVVENPVDSRARVQRLALLALAIWASVCVLVLRPGYAGNERSGGIVNERTYWQWITGVEHPVTIDDWGGSDLVRRGVRYRDMAADGRDVLVLPSGQEIGLAPGRGVIVVVGNIGALPRAAGVDVRVVDLHGLADPLASRTEKASGPIVGHEKSLPDVWSIARFVAPNAGDAPDVVAARQALACGEIHELLRAIEQPLNPAQFAANFVAAPRLTALRVPRRPPAAREQFCAAAG